MNTPDTRYTLNLKAILPILRPLIVAEDDLAGSAIAIGIGLQNRQVQDGVEYRLFRLNWGREPVQLRVPTDQYEDIFALEGECDLWDCIRTPETLQQLNATLQALEAKWLR